YTPVRCCPDFRLIDVEADNAMALLDEPAGKTLAHQAKADEADRPFLHEFSPCSLIHRSRNRAKRGSPAPEHSGSHIHGQCSWVRRHFAGTWFATGSAPSMRGNRLRPPRWRTGEIVKAVPLRAQVQYSAQLHGRRPA